MNLIENEVSRFLSVFQIKNDVLTILKLVNILKDGVSQMLIFPYLSLFCHESISYIDKYNATDNSPLSKSIHIQMNRNKLKQYDLSFLKNIKMLNSVDQVQNNYFNL